MMKNLKLKKHDEILDISAGTGILAEEIAMKYGPFKRLVLNDPSKSMLERTKYRMRYVKHVEFSSQFAEELSFPEESFSKIICLNSFHYYTEQREAVNHVFRVLKPGGTFYILDWNRKGGFVILNAIIKLLSRQNINTRNCDELRKILAENGFILEDQKEWRYWWWKFFFLKCSKP